MSEKSSARCERLTVAIRSEGNSVPHYNLGMRDLKDKSLIYKSTAPSPNNSYLLIYGRPASLSLLLSKQVFCSPLRRGGFSPQGSGRMPKLVKPETSPITKDH